ncbi:hypothetical protein NDU88_007244 [Pleurodeles waltl]|uniref:Uncharacterized protein n=1 Tax=Pleurodeles waltl TaxID=8319 RepID=A0AAV7RUC0_PLEWA|nr:hypothetical protein NDU88_007242 [Pleurodeles waltl]KAJ1154492.1 hypothetical protein NDU88_007244 [Pleurodeles waltl]
MARHDAQSWALENDVSHGRKKVPRRAPLLGKHTAAPTAVRTCSPARAIEARGLEEELAGLPGLALLESLSVIWGFEMDGPTVALPFRLVGDRVISSDLPFGSPLFTMAPGLL